MYMCCMLTLSNRSIQEEEEGEEEAPEFVAEDEIEESDLSDIEVHNHPIHLMYSAFSSPGTLFLTYIYKDQGAFHGNEAIYSDLPIFCDHYLPCVLPTQDWGSVRTSEAGGGEESSSEASSESEREEEEEEREPILIGRKRTRAKARVEIEYETELEPRAKIKAV